MSDDHVRSASVVFDVEDADNGERFRVYRCDECKALVLSDDAREHLWWHDALLYHHTPSGRLLMTRAIGHSLTPEALSASLSDEQPSVGIPTTPEREAGVTSLTKGEDR